MNFQEPLSGLFERIARAIERLGPRMPVRPDFEAADAFVWQAPDFGKMAEADTAAWWKASVTFPDDFRYVKDG